VRGFVHPLFQISDPEFDLRRPLALWNCRRGEDCRRRAPMDESDAAKPQRDHEGRGLTKNLSMDDPRTGRGGAGESGLCREARFSNASALIPHLE
jgi:hypothetical protein